MSLLSDFGIEPEEIPTAEESRLRSASAVRENISKEIERATSNGKHRAIINSNINSVVLDQVIQELRGKGYEVNESTKDTKGHITIFWGENNAS